MENNECVKSIRVYFIYIITAPYFLYVLMVFIIFLFGIPAVITFFNGLPIGISHYNNAIAPNHTIEFSFLLKSVMYFSILVGFPVVIFGLFLYIKIEKLKN